MTYGDLEIKANQLAHYLRENGVGAEDRWVFIYHVLKNPIALLAILKAGGVFVPFDLTYPAERIAYMLNDFDPVRLSHYTFERPASRPIKKICLDSESESIDACDPGKPVQLQRIIRWPILYIPPAQLVVPKEP